MDSVKEKAQGIFKRPASTGEDTEDKDISKQVTNDMKDGEGDKKKDSEEDNTSFYESMKEKAQNFKMPSFGKKEEDGEKNNEELEERKEQSGADGLEKTNQMMVHQKPNPLVSLFGMMRKKILCALISGQKICL